MSVREELIQQVLAIKQLTKRYLKITGLFNRQATDFGNGNKLKTISRKKWLSGFEGQQGFCKLRRPLKASGEYRFLKISKGTHAKKRLSGMAQIEPR